MELAYILALIFAFTLVKKVLEDRTNARTERAHLLEQALKQQHLDRETIDGLAYQLTGKSARGRREDVIGRRARALVLAIGWFTMFGGAATWIAGELTRDRDATQVGIILLLCGFAVTTYPFALRELEARRGVQ